MILQLLYEANTCLPCPVSGMPNDLRGEIGSRLGAFLNVIENMEGSHGSIDLPMEIISNRAHEMAVISLLPTVALLSPASYS